MAIEERLLGEVDQTLIEARRRSITNLSGKRKFLRRELDSRPENVSPRSPMLFDCVGRIIGRLPAPITRVIVLSALGAAMIWLFSPSKRNKTPGPIGIPVETASIPTLPVATQASEAVNEAVKNAESVAAGTRPNPLDPSLPESSVKPAKSDFRTAPASTSRRRAAPRQTKGKLSSNRYKPLWQREIANLKIRLMALWRRSALSGAADRKRKVSSH